MAGELIEFGHGVSGIAMNLEEDQVGAVLLGEYQHIREGDEVRRTARLCPCRSVKRWSDAWWMRSAAIDVKAPSPPNAPTHRKYRAWRYSAPAVKQPMQTGIKAIDA